eukprot:TRINITY_DN17426_c0_g1_i2.p1 TRINITY_DN17426_c0_g1~~TRINITY_DN17426_c0_g1_i2.p1  ORF type:complete len:290 (+),score=68.24 TRINITY_DN17426_c0_g1_i2:95-871(+)
MAATVSGPLWRLVSMVLLCSDFASGIQAFQKGHRGLFHAAGIEQSNTMPQMQEATKSAKSDSASAVEAMKAQLKEYDCKGNFEKPGDSDIVVVVAGHPECDVTFLADQPHKAYIFSDVDKDMHKHYSGYEAGAYLNFILQNYENLPEKMAFVHGHRKAWEIGDEAKILMNLDKNSYPYAGLSKKWAVDLRRPDIRDTKEFLAHVLDPAEVAKLQRMVEAGCPGSTTTSKRVRRSPGIRSSMRALWSSAGTSSWVRMRR